MRPRLVLAGLALMLVFVAPGVVSSRGGAQAEDLPPAALARVLYWTDGYQRWNEIARDLIWLNDVSAPRAARVYAALSAAQWQAWQDATRLPVFAQRDQPTALMPPGRAPPSAPQRAAARAGFRPVKSQQASPGGRRRRRPCSNTCGSMAAPSRPCAVHPHPATGARATARPALTRRGDRCDPG
jgi:hypothetical protein